jgi:hypothetical protein
MTVQINSNYLEKYSSYYAEKVCSRFFSDRQFISGQEILQLTSSTQVNFFVIKRLFELWQDELAKLKSSPYFDYRDIAVHEALTQFMNVLSRRIKVERSYLQPMVEAAVAHAIQVATDPVAFYQSEINKAPAGKINEYLKENKKYYKWHDKVVTFLIDKAGFGYDKDSYLKAISANYQVIKDSLESVNLLLATLGDVQVFDLDHYIIGEALVSDEPIVEVPKTETSFFDEPEIVASKPEPATPVEERPAPVSVAPVSTPSFTFSGAKLQAAKLKSHFASESYKGMKGILGELSESVAINQRFMFTKELFDGNADLLRHALKSIDGLDSFEEAVELVNSRYVEELNWDINSDAVHEFMQLVYRKFF